MKVVVTKSSVGTQSVRDCLMGEVGKTFTMKDLETGKFVKKVYNGENMIEFHQSLAAELKSIVEVHEKSLTVIG